MKKVLIYGYTSTVGGVETFISNLLMNIDKNEFKIDLLLQEELKGINKERIKNNYDNYYVINNIKKHPVKTLKELFSIYKKNKYDVIYMCLSTASSCIYALPSKIFNRNTKIIIHSHNGNDRKKFQHYLFRILLNKIADKKIACSKLASNWMFGKRKKDVILINNAIQTNLFTYNKNIRENIRQSLNISDSEFVIGHVGRFNEQKNHTELIDIFNNYLKINSNSKLLLIGAGELEEVIKNKAKKLGILEKILFLGVKSNVNEYYQAMDIFVMPSLFEGLPIVGIEAQTSGLTCLFSDNITKESDIVGTSKFIGLRNIEIWCKEIKKINENQKEIDRLNGKIINSIIEKGYDLRTETKKIENMFKE